LEFGKAIRKSFKERSLLKDEKWKDIRLGLELGLRLRLMSEEGRTEGRVGARSGHVGSKIFYFSVRRTEGEVDTDESGNEGRERVE